MERALYALAWNVPTFFMADIDDYEEEKVVAVNVSTLDEMAI
jgi:hypothetical protein